MRYGLLALLLISLAFAKPVLIVIDASGSMNDALDSGVAKIDAAKTAATHFIASSSSNDVGVMRFSYCTDTTAAPDPLQGDIRVLQPFTSDQAALNRAVDSIQAQGDTPIAFAIQEAVEYFKSQNKRDGVIVLLTDGEETCGGDPEAAAEAAHSQGYAVINVIAYNLDPEALTKAERVAQAGGGHVYTATNEQELERAFTQAGGGSSVCCIPTFIFGAVGVFTFLSLRKRT